jgi:hypothetical protein
LGNPAPPAGGRSSGFTHPSDVRAPRQWPVRPGPAPQGPGIADIIVGGVVEGLRNLPPPGNSNQGYIHRTPTYPQPAYPQPSYPQPSSSQPPPSNTVRTQAPPRNTVVVARKPVANAQFNLSDTEYERMSAEFDARQASEAAEAGGKMDVAIQEAIDLYPGPEKKEMKAAWVEAMLSGDPEKFKAFQRDYGDKLPQIHQDVLETRITIGEYQKDLLAGLVTSDDQRLADIKTKVAGWPPSVFKDSVQGNVAQMDKYSELGKLAALVQGTDNPLQVMLLGIESAGFEPSLMADVCGQPIITEPPTADSVVAVQDILLLNPEQNGQDISYTLANSPFTMKPGEKQSLNRSYTLLFDPGNGAAAKQVTLVSGVYHFVLDAGAWDVLKVTPRVTLDNTRYSGPFRYVVNSQQATLAAGQVTEHTGDSGIVIEFDRGDGGPPARKLLSTGVYFVGIDPAKQCLELYESHLAPSLSSPVSPPGNNFVDAILNSAIEAAAPPMPAKAARVSNPPAKSRQRQIEEALARLKTAGK